MLREIDKIAYFEEDWAAKLKRFKPGDVIRSLWIPNQKDSGKTTLTNMRLDAGLLSCIDAIAKVNGRTRTSQIEMMLRECTRDTSVEQADAELLRKKYTPELDKKLARGSWVLDWSERGDSPRLFLSADLFYPERVDD